MHWIQLSDVLTTLDAHDSQTLQVRSPGGVLMRRTDQTRSTMAVRSPPPSKSLTPPGLTPPSMSVNTSQRRGVQVALRAGATCRAVNLTLQVLCSGEPYV